ncbi:VOC family protein [Enterococcus sp. LJL98]
MLKTTGIHHISSIVGHAQRNLDFYAGILGTRLVKKTLNFDDKESYHLYYGNTDGSTGLITTFPWTDAIEGRVGDGQVGVASCAVPTASFPFWKERFEKFEIPHFEYTRFGKKRMGFKDPDGLELELIEGDDSHEQSWAFNGIEKEDAFIGIQSATLYSREPEKTLQMFVEVLGYEKVAEDEEMIRLVVHEGLGGAIELNKKHRRPGRMGIGAVHHIAFKVKETEIEAWRHKLIQAGHLPTEIKNRKYFKALYFREKGGILIELSTEGPGVLVDEPLETLGETLLIPPHYAAKTPAILADLMPLQVRPIEKMGEYGYRNRYEYEILEKKKEIKHQIKQLKARQKERALTQAEENELQLLRQQVTKIK